MIGQSKNKYNSISPKLGCNKNTKPVITFKNPDPYQNYLGSFWKIHILRYCSFSPDMFLMSFPGGSEVKASACNVGDPGSIPGSGRSPGEANGNLLQYSCLENHMDRGAWWAIVHGITKNLDMTEQLTFLLSLLLQLVR